MDAFEEKFYILKKQIDQCQAYKYEPFFVELNYHYNKCYTRENRKLFVENLIENKTIEKFLRKKKLQNIEKNMVV